MSLGDTARCGFALALMASSAISAAELSSPTLDELVRQQAALSARIDSLTQQRQTGPGNVRLTDLSLIVLSAVGASTATDDEIPDLQGGGHDPNRRGFTFQGAELSIAGEVDAYFRAEVHLVAIRDEPSGETGIELEEAFARSTALPGGLEAKLGLYLLEFGRFNPTHPHAWQFIDQPVVISRVFGGDGQRTPGARLAWSLPTPWLSDVLIGVADANGETAPSFLSNDEEGPRAGWNGVENSTRSPADFVYQARWTNAFDVADTITKYGVSVAGGPNSAGDDSRTVLLGADLGARWHPAGGERGWPFVLFEAEAISRSYAVGATELVDASGAAIGNADATTLRDHGFVLQAVYGFVPGWAAGVRGEHCWAKGQSITLNDAGDQVLSDPAADATRDTRTRLSALLSWQPSEFTHFRLQYNHDRAEHLPDHEHSVWFGAEFLIGAHPAHVF